MQARPGQMKFKAQKDELAAVIQTVQRTTTNRTPLPVLTGIHLEAADNRLTATSTDLEMGIQCTIPVTVEEEGATVIPAKTLTGLISRLPETEISVSTDHSTVTSFTYGNSSFDLNGFPVDEFPKFPAMPDNPVLRIKQGKFKKLLKQVLFAVSTDSARPIFTGVHLRITEEGQLSMVATDTRRLAVCEERLDTCPDRPVDIVVPGKTLNEFSRLLDSEENEFEVFITENQVFFRLENTCIMSRLIAGQYPNYGSVVPREYRCEVKAPVEALMEAAERAALLADVKRNVFSAFIQPEGILFAFEAETGRVHEEVRDIEFNGEPIQLGLNVKLFVEQLKAAAEAERVTIKLSGAQSPALFQPEGAEGYFSLLVPAVA